MVEAIVSNAPPLSRTPASPSFVQQLAALVRKDLLIELKRRDTVISAAVFSLLVLLTFVFALDLRREVVPDVAPGVLWVTFIFAGVITLNRSFALEKDRGTWDGLLLAPVDRGA